jgi:uncharacterized membrane protein
MTVTREHIRAALRWLLALLFVAAGVNHFVSPDFYVSIMPPYLPWHLALVYASGVAEVAIGVGALPPRTRRLAGFGAIALLLAVFPANLHMAMHPELYPDVGRWALYARLPFQLVFIAWAWWVCLAERPTRAL